MKFAESNCWPVNFAFQEEVESIDPASLVNAVNLEEAKYLLQHFINLSITKVKYFRLFSQLHLLTL